MLLHNDGRVQWHVLPWGKKSLDLARGWGDILFSEVFWD